MTQLIVLTRIRQGRLRWKMCRRNCFTSTTKHCVLFQSFSVRGRMPWILEHPVLFWRAENPGSCGAASHGPGPKYFWFTVQQANVRLSWLFSSSFFLSSTYTSRLRSDAQCFAHPVPSWTTCRGSATDPGWPNVWGSEETSLAAHSVRQPAIQTCKDLHQRPA